MLTVIREEFPQAHYIETGNANVNAPMLSINQRLGFRRYQTQMLAIQNVADLCQRLGIEFDPVGLSENGFPGFLSR